MKKTAFAAAMIAALAMSMTACGNKKPVETKEETSAAAEETTPSETAEETSALETEGAKATETSQTETSQAETVQGETSQTEADPATGNHPELKAYYKYLTDNSWIVNYQSSYDDKKMAVMDLNNDGVYEATARYTCGSSESFVLLSYGSELHAWVTNTEGEERMGYPFEYMNEAEGTFLLGRTRGKSAYELYQMNSDGTSTELDIFGMFEYEDWDEEQITRFENETSGMGAPIWVDITSENLVKYLTGDGMKTGVDLEDMP